jgi:hypothetical protein
VRRFRLSVKPLELAGIEFIEENGGGPGVRLRKRQTEEAKRSIRIGGKRLRRQQQLPRGSPLTPNFVMNQITQLPS